MTSSDFIMVYLTTSSRNEAETIGRALVTERLAACINILGEVRSIYQWNGGVEESNEVAVIAKTHRELFDKLNARVKELHSYDTPCVVSYAMSNADADYLGWLSAMTTSTAKAH